ncbi:MAG: YhcH/YjgK/YiaL family protein [Clostridia bacterium]
MIYDKLNNLNKYFNNNKVMSKLSRFLEDNDVYSFPDGKYKIDGDNLFVVLMSYNAKDKNECKLESHEKYIDIQAILSGEEKIEYVKNDESKSLEPYNEEKDIQFFEGSGIELNVKESEFVLFMPKECHRPSYNVTPNAIRKMLVKILFNW